MPKGCDEMRDLKQDLFSAPYYHKGNLDHGVLLIHGFTGSPANLLPLAKKIGDAGFTVYSIRLTGHGTTLEDFKKSRWQDWLLDVFQGFDDLSQECSRVSLVGLSMGGALALILAEHRPVFKVITLAAALKTRNRMAPAANLFRCLPVNPYCRWHSEMQQPNELALFHSGYEGAYVKNIASLNTIMKMARRDLNKISCPLLVVRAGKDKTVRKESADLILSRTVSAEKVLLELPDSPHVCVLGPESERLLNEILSFLQNEPTIEK